MRISNPGTRSARPPGPLLRHPGAARQVRRASAPLLRIRCRWRLLAARVGPDRDGPRPAPSPSCSAARSSSASSSGSRRPFQATRTPPSREQRGGELGERAEPADGAGGDGVVGLAALAAGPVLGARVDRAGVGEAAGGRGALDELALAPDRLDQVDPRVGQRRGEDEAGEAGAGADVADRAGRGELGERRGR